MTESRCGILCTACSFKQTMGCAGCTEIEKPFWAEKACAVKACCETHGHDHCGRCAEFACALLKQFSYDPEQGDNGKRIAQCAQWSKEEGHAVNAL